MSSAPIDFADFQGRVDAVLAAAVDHAAGGGLSFDAPVDPEVVSLADLIASARAADDEAALHFSAGGGLFDDLWREFNAFVAGVWRDLTHLAIVDTAAGESVQCHTRIGWTGDTTCFVAPGTPRERVLVHDAAVRAAVTVSVGRIRLLVTIAGAAGKIAAMIATPGAAVMALPVAYKCVRDLYEQWINKRPVKGPGG
jgi:hypothetical protein